MSPQNLNEHPNHRSMESSPDHPEIEDLTELIRKAKKGDRHAAEQIVERYEAQIRMEARTRLSGSQLRALFESADIAQSVFRLFFTQENIVNKAAQDPRYLAELFAMMTKRKIIDHWRRQTAGKRDVRKTNNLDDVLAELAEQQSEPDEIVAFRELHERILNCLNPEERRLARQRFEGDSWQEIADHISEKPDAIRMRLSRAIRRACQELGIDPLI